MSKPEKTVLSKAAQKDEFRMNRAALSLLSHFKMAFKASKIYEPSNQIVQGQTRILFSLVESILQTEAEASFLIRQSTLFFNGTKVRFTFNSYDLFRFMSEEMKKRGVGLLTFLPGLTEEELRVFLAVMAQKPPKVEINAAEFAAVLARANILHVYIEAPQSYDVYVGDEREAVKLFFLGISHLKDLFEKFKRGESLPINITRRLMHSLFNHIVYNEAFSLGLTTIKNFDDYTLNHSLNVCILSIALGRRLGLDKNELTDLGISAFFHDYGKMEIPKEILDKPGKLEESEWALIVTHPQLGAEKLLRLSEKNAVPVGAINVAMEHHIKEDLNGYPSFQKKKNISLLSKIVKICDVFDALTTLRPYREHTYTREEALKILIKDSDTSFDPIIVKVFTQMLGLYPVGSLVLLDTRELAIVFETHAGPALSTRPLVLLITDPSGNRIVGDIVDLTEQKPDTHQYLRTIVKAINPAEYDIRVSDYFLDKAQEGRSNLE